MLQAPLQNSLRRAGSAEKELRTSRDQLRQLRDAARPPLELDLHACSVQQGVDQAPQAKQPVTGRRHVSTHTGPRERKQLPPPPTAHFALDHRAAVWSPFRTGVSTRACDGPIGPALQGESHRIDLNARVCSTMRSCDDCLNARAANTTTRYSQAWVTSPHQDSLTTLY